MNFVTREHLHPYRYSSFQLDTDSLQRNIHTHQRAKITETTIWQALRSKISITRDSFVQRWGEYISNESELEFRQTFDCGFSVYSDLDKNYYTATKIHISMNSCLDFIVKPEDGTRYHIDLNVILIIDKSYLKPFSCGKTPNCPYKVFFK